MAGKSPNLVIDVNLQIQEIEEERQPKEINTKIYNN